MEYAKSSKSRTIEERFWQKVDKTPGLGAGGNCWEWTAALNDYGYGVFEAPVSGGKRMTGAHRVAYELMTGPIPSGLFVLHNCDNRKCVNPAHLRPGTAKENTRDMITRGRAGIGNGNKEKAECKNGHPFTEQNTYIRKDGGRSCLACAAARARRQREEAKKAALLNPLPPKPRKRKTHCLRGHEFNSVNTNFNTDKHGWAHQDCRICDREAQKAKRAERQIPQRTPITHCMHGHEFTPENTYKTGTGRNCKACAIARVTKKRERQKH